jgi:hypothetical protein
MPRGPRQFYVRDPNFFLLLLCLPSSHPHNRILPMTPRTHQTFPRPRITTYTTGC